MEDRQHSTFEGITHRLRDIRSQVEDTDLPLDDALSLFEEAVELGMQASALLEEGLAQPDDPEKEAASQPRPGEPVEGYPG